MAQEDPDNQDTTFDFDLDLHTVSIGEKVDKVSKQLKDMKN